MEASGCREMDQMFQLACRKENADPEHPGTPTVQYTNNTTNPHRLATVPRCPQVKGRKAKLTKPQISTAMLRSIHESNSNSRTWCKKTESTYAYQSSSLGSNS